MKHWADRLRHGATAAGDADLPASFNREQESGGADRRILTGPRRSEDRTCMPAVVAV
jgi:hypothetical protein